MDVVDCTGKTLVPGIFDCHVHIMVSTLDLVTLIKTPFSYQFFEAAKNLRTLLGIGITTVCDACGADLGITRAVESGLIRGVETKDLHHDAVPNGRPRRCVVGVRVID